MKSSSVLQVKLKSYSQHKYFGYTKCDVLENSFSFRKSLEEHQAASSDMNKEKRDIELAIARSMIDHQRLEGEKKSQEELMEQQMKKLTTNSSSSAPPGRKSINI